MPVDIDIDNLRAAAQPYIDLARAHPILVICSLVLLQLTATRYRSGLRKVPGPFVASFSNLWKLRHAFKQDMPQMHLKLHEKFGPIVRIGPNHVSVNDPESLKTIYGRNSGFTKTPFYPIAEGVYKGRPLPNLFTTRSEKYHAQLTRAVVHAYSMTAMVELEPFVDSCLTKFIERLNEFTEARKPVDISSWLHYFAFDVLGEINFSQRLGFMDKGGDVDNMIGAIDGVLSYVSVIGQVPAVHSFLLGNPLLPKLVPNFEKVNEVQNFALRMIEARSKDPVQRNDILARLFKTHKADPTKLSYDEIVSVTTTNVIAGSDTTAVALRAALYYLCINPHCYAKIIAEIKDFENRGKFSNPITYNEANALPYLTAVLKEAMRIHPSTGYILERHVPKGGATLAGVYLPEGTIVGVNAWSIHYNKEVYGEDVNTFRPERWIDSSPEQLKEMERNFFNFGAGSRVCIGKNIALLEMWKVLAELLRHFDFELANPKKPWRVHGIWFTKQTEMDMVLRRRV